MNQCQGQDEQSCIRIIFKLLGVLGVLAELVACVSLGGVAASYGLRLEPQAAHLAENRMRRTTIARQSAILVPSDVTGQNGYAGGGVVDASASRACSRARISSGV